MYFAACVEYLCYKHAKLSVNNPKAFKYHFKRLNDYLSRHICTYTVKPRHLEIIHRE